MTGRTVCLAPLLSSSSDNRPAVNVGAIYGRSCDSDGSFDGSFDATIRRWGTSVGHTGVYDQFALFELSDLCVCVDNIEQVLIGRKARHLERR